MVACRQRGYAFAPRVDDDAFEDSWAEEPVYKEDPDSCEGEVFEQSFPSPYGLWTSKESKEECRCCPAPSAFDEIDIEGIGFGGEKVGFGEWVWEVGQKWI